MNKENMILHTNTHTHGIVFRLKKKETLLFSAKWKDTVLNENRYRETYTASPHVYVKSKIVKLIQPESIMVVVRGWEEDEMK